VRTPIWSPDGKTIAATDMAGHPRLHSFPRSVDDPLPKAGPVPAADRRGSPNSWSPDSKELAGFIIRADASVTGGIVVYDVEKKTYRRTIDSFALSPDDRSLFVAWASTQADLWLMALGGKR
jgi:Tol biopolymer transport system component